MKKVYIIFSVLLVIGISSGIYYFTEYRQSKMVFPKEIVMETHNGKSYSFNDMPPKVRLLEFIYTECPDICPNTTFQMKKVRDHLEDKGKFGNEVEFLTITFDPKKDTQDVLKNYAENFEIDKQEGWELLRGTDGDTKKLADQFNFQYRDPGTGQFIHTSATYLVDQNNRVIEVFGMGQGNFDKDKVYKRIMKELN
ncbi:SCO family protein [Peribacillus saganii]|uniref:SCO family protein n=1 Tax=Peribacillus saganii TaxID=2303992 RepID=A0A372LEB1_9BACI|nr:SCO family protein [Peribacillus saganii]RFU63545.1 SCO family protein [Peribacillus saganii]